MSFLQARLAAVLSAIKGDFNTLDTRITALESLGAGSNYSIFPIWAEENASLASDAYEWSWGNGATGTDIGIPVAMDCELFAVSFNADTFGNQVSVRTQGNASVLYEATFTSNNQVVDVPVPVPVNRGTRIDFRTGTVSGGFTDARVCAWFRQSVSPTLLLQEGDV